MSGLNIPQSMPIGVGNTGVQSIEQVWSTAGYIEDQIHSKGVDDYNQPQFPCPILTPETFNLADAKTASDNYLYLNSWYSFIAELLAKVNLYILEYENMLSHLEAQMRDSYRQISKAGDKMTKEEIADRILLNPQHMSLTRTLQQYKQYKERLNTRAEAIGRSMRVLSRQIEIRRQDLEQNMIGGGMANRGAMTPARGRFGAP